MLAVLATTLVLQGTEETYPRCPLVEDEVVDAAVRSGELGEVRELIVAATARNVARLARSRKLRRVRRVVVCTDDAGVLALLRARWLKRVEELTVVAYDAPLAASTVEALVTSPRLRRLRALDFDAGDSEAEKTIDGEGLRALAVHAELPALVALDLSWNAVTTGAASALIRSTWVAQLEGLDLCHAAVDHGALVEERWRLTRLRALCVDDPEAIRASYDGVLMGDQSY